MRESARLYDLMLRERLPRSRAAFVCGPSHVGKTTACKALSACYLDWNDPAHRRLILRGPEAVGRQWDLEHSREREVTVVFDNFHGYRHWREFLRSFSVRYGARVRVVVTLLSLKNRLPSRSSLVRINPWTVGECARRLAPESAIGAPGHISDEEWLALLEHGGFPEPFRKRDARFTQRWHIRRQSELVEYDLPRLAAVRDPALLQMLAVLLSEASANPLSYSDLGRQLGVSVDTTTRWVELLVDMQYGFCVRPWFTGVPKALRREPRWFLRDWSAVLDPTARLRTLIACHLLKSVEGWTDLGLGRFELRYIRDKLQREVDFLVLRERRPWFLVSVAGEPPRGGAAPPVLAYFQRITRAPHAFHVVMNASFCGLDCFAQTEPAVVSARTLLSQLL